MGLEVPFNGRLMRKRVFPNCFQGIRGANHRHVRGVILEKLAAKEVCIPYTLQQGLCSWRRVVEVKEKASEATRRAGWSLWTIYRL